jgi:hypothetical protein
MIRPLRRCHRWLVPTLFLLLIAAALLSMMHPAPSVRLHQLPAIIVDVTEPAATR